MTKITDEELDAVGKALYDAGWGGAPPTSYKHNCKQMYGFQEEWRKTARNAIKAVERVRKVERKLGH